MKVEAQYIKIIDLIGEFLIESVKSAKASGIVFGISGGIDSALVAALASKFLRDKNFAIRMDINNLLIDIQDANSVIEQFQNPFIAVNLEPTYKLLSEELEKKAGIKNNNLSLLNLKPRLRMNTLYFYAANFNYLVCATSNAAEILTGYFTKFGDGAGDIAPLANLTKTDVYEIAKLLNVPKRIIQKAPSAGLYENQTDEKELGISYAHIDAYLNKELKDKKAIALIETLHEKSMHKKEPIKTILKLGEVF